MTVFRRRLGALAAGGLVALSAQAGRPLQTEDAGVLARGDCEIEGVSQRARAGGQTATQRSVALGCGIGADSQLALAFAVDHADGDRRQGFALKAKTALWDDAAASEHRAALTIAWQVLGDRSPAGASRHVGTGAQLVLTLPVAGPHQLHANLGHDHQRLDRRGSTVWGLGVEHAGLGPQGRWAPMAELYGDDRQAPWWNLGLRFTLVAERAFVDLAYGQQLVGSRPSQISAGLKLGF